MVIRRRPRGCENPRREGDIAGKQPRPAVPDTSAAGPWRSRPMPVGYQRGGVEAPGAMSRSNKVSSEGNGL